LNLTSLFQYNIAIFILFDKFDLNLNYINDYKTHILSGRDYIFVFLFILAAYQSDDNYTIVKKILNHFISDINLSILSPHCLEFIPEEIIQSVISYCSFLVQFSLH
jgi:hypothetical protein